MWVLSDQEILRFVGQFFWPFCRVGAFFLATPIFGSQLVTARVRLILALLISVVAAPLIPSVPVVPSLSLQTLVIVVQQVIIGLAMGFLLQVIFHVFILAGQLMAMKMGLGFASMNDPSSGVVVTVVSQFYLLVTTVLFLALNGHLIMVDVLVRSFTVLPIGMSGIADDGLLQIANLGSWMFQGALMIALPVLTSLLIVNLAFGVMNRAAPQMNVFTVGFPITLLFGLVLIWLSLSTFLPLYENFIDYGFQALQDVLGAR